MRIQFIRLDETGHRSTKRKLYRAERQSVGIAHLELAHTERLIVKRAGMVWEKLIIGDVLEPAKYRSEEHTSELQSLMRISYAVFCLKKKTRLKYNTYLIQTHTITNI